MKMKRNGWIGIVALAVVAAAAGFFIVRRNRSHEKPYRQQTSFPSYRRGQTESRSELQRETAIMEDSDNRMFDAFPDDTGI